MSYDGQYFSCSLSKMKYNQKKKEKGFGISGEAFLTSTWVGSKTYKFTIVPIIKNLQSYIYYHYALYTWMFSYRPNFDKVRGVVKFVVSNTGWNAWC